MLRSMNIYSYTHMLSSKFLSKMCQVILTISDDDLYELGMDSLMAMMISSKIQKELGYNMQLSDMYDISCVREISDFLGSADKTEISGTNVDISCEPEKSLDDLFDDL